MDGQGLTPLMKASVKGKLEIVQLLLRYGANPRIKDLKGESALAKACA